MAIPTINYSAAMDPGYPGMIATTEPHWIVSAIVALTSAAVPFGSAVVYGTTDDVVALPTAGGVFAGICVADRMQPSEANASIPPGKQIGVMKTGPMWVLAAATVKAGDPVSMTATGGLSTGTGTGLTPIVGAEWASSASSGGLARLRLGVTR
ncbi:structural cement protein Gp24 [Roseomonas mucosa]|uniref:structural cement protein Gp24 n=1 Tax=Roseomonas mucosa TaxID=207340 RepID=UPI0022455767|nr:capsid cement protein [Roseomonas mucosa]UZO91758.1 Hypothetical protein RMP42_06001 [Roseomonas mucosa]